MCKYRSQTCNWKNNSSKALAWLVLFFMENTEMLQILYSEVCITVYSEYSKIEKKTTLIKNKEKLRYQNSS